MKNILLVQPGDLNDALHSVRFVTSIIHHYADARVYMICNGITQHLHAMLKGITRVLIVPASMSDWQKIVSEFSDSKGIGSIDLIINLELRRSDDIDDLIGELPAKEKIGTSLSYGIRTPFEREYFDSCYSSIINLPSVAVPDETLYRKFIEGMEIPLSGEFNINFNETASGLDNETVSTLTDYFVLIQSQKEQIHYPPLKRVVQLIRDQYPVQIVLITDEGEVNDCNESDNLLRFDPLSMSMKEMVTLLKNADLVIGVETSLTLLARMMGKRTIALMSGHTFLKDFVYTSDTSLIYLPLNCFDCGAHCVFKTAFCVTEIDPEIVIREVQLMYTSRPDKMRIVQQKEFLWRFDSGLLSLLQLEELIAEECEFVIMETEESPSRFTLRNYEILTAGLTNEMVQELNQLRFHIDTVQAGSEVMLDQEEENFYRNAGEIVKKNLQLTDVSDFKDPFIYYVLGFIDFQEKSFAESARNFMLAYHKGLGSLWLLRRIAKILYLAGCELLSYEIMKNFNPDMLDDDESALLKTLSAKYTVDPVSNSIDDRFPGIPPQFGSIVEQIQHSLSNNDLADSQQRLVDMKHALKECRSSDNISQNISFQQYHWLKAKYHLLKKEFKSALHNYELAIQFAPHSTELLTEYASLLRKTGRKTDANRVGRAIKLYSHS